MGQATMSTQQPMASGGKAGGMDPSQMQSIGNMAAGQQNIMQNGPAPMAQPGQPIPGQPTGSPQPDIGAGKSGGAITMPGQSGQPVMGQPNQYSNTTGQQPAPAYNQPQAIAQNAQGGKGKGS
jgi:hypothetical protein